MNDIRKFITSTTCNYFGVNESAEPTVESDALEKFITDAQCLTLCVVIQNELIEYHSEILRGKLGSLFFHKSIPVALESDNAFQHINITAFTNNPVESLYLSLHHIYGPLLQLDNSMALDPKIQEMLSHLEAALRTIAYGKDGAPSLMVVLTVDDELEYWKTIGDDSKTRKQREMSESFISILQPMTEEIRSIEMNGIPEIQEALESLGGLLDDLWRHPTYTYPQKRMIHLMDVIGNACVVKLQDILNLVNVWGPDTSIIIVLKECYSAATCWLSACHSLTQKYWPHHSLHAWEGQPHIPQYLKIFQERLKEIADVRSIHMQLTKLLSASEQEELKTAKMFQPFDGLALWQCTPSSNSNWVKAKSHFERLLKPAEDRIAVKLRPRLISSSTKQMLHEFSRYSALIERPTVHVSLQKECEVFCNALKDMLKEIENQTDNEKIPLDNEFTTPDISPLVQHLQWTKKMTNKVSEIENVIEHLLKDLDGCAELIHLAKSVQKDLFNSQTQLYEDWTRELQIELNNKSLILSPESPVVVFSSENNLMHVTFNPRLVSLERDIRHMASLGFTIPLPVKDAVNHAAQFMEHARALQQVANFHNTQGDRMILSQRPMMLQGAVKLASLVKEQSAVPWKDIEAVAKYVEKLKEAVSNLVSQNTYLTNQHIAMRNIVLGLMDTELLQKQAEWKKGVRQMRDIADKVDAKGFTNNKVWKTHWDIQLYKALEHQYRSTLINPLSNLSITRVELIFRQQEVRLQPPLEELRASCHAQLRKLIALPHHFAGLLSAASESESIFTSIVPRNSWLICGALQEVEKTLEKVKEAAKRWSRWGALGAAGDLDSLCELHLQQPQDWDRNFRECKALGQAIAKLPMEDERVDWIWISSASLRSELEAHNRRYWVALTTSLQASLQRDTTALEEYIFAAQNTLGQNVPKNAKELATANEEYHTLKEKESQMTSLLEGLRKKQSMVRAWGGERIRSLDHLAKQWENLTSLMQNHEQLIIHQAESVKSSLLGEWSNLCSSLEVWYSRWLQNKPKADQLANLPLSELQTKHQLVIDALQHWSNFQENKENMIIECRKFNFELEVKPLWKEVETKMLEESTFWEPFSLFNEAYKSMSSQEWIVFQKKLHTLDEFVGEWGPKLEPLTAITLFIKKEINQFKDIIPSLKHLRGTDFTEKHWREIYSLLGIPNKSADELVLGDFLNVAATIKINSKSLQKIWSSASQEAVVRGAVAELELWLAGARFVIVKHTDSKGQEVSIIKDYKDILNKVEEYESLAGSARAASGGGGSDQLALWEVRLSQLRVALTSLSHIQRKWVYLEPILSSGGGGDGAFLRLDRDWRQAARTLDADPRPAALLTRLPAFSPLLDSLMQQLQRCQAALQQYIAEKRSTFPRLYFLSDDDLLELAGGMRSGREAALRAHVKKLFPGATGLQLGPGGASVTALTTKHDQKLVLDSPVDIDAPVEVWLKRLEEQMKSSLRTCILQCMRSGTSHNRDALMYPTQVLCLVQSIQFTETAEKAITGRNLHIVRDGVRKELELYIKADVLGEDEYAERSKLQALILQCNNYLDILDELIENSVSSLDHWIWQKQLRFYVENKTDIVACMGLAKLPYTYEYLGANTGTLVRTQLTDQCFLILTQALHLGQAGNPFGPAGTGKTESVKALGGLLGRLVLVFNCDEGMDKTTLGRLLTGLALSSSWGCFDEFNRLEEKTLSGVAQQFASLLGAIASKDTNRTATLNGKEVPVGVGCGVFVTLNPAGAGYGGRRELPGSISRLLRPAAMWSPRAAHIARALLATHSFTHSTALADKLVVCYQMASSLLSPMHHYDWGLRALKTVIGSCGTAIRDFMQTSKSFPNESQQMAVVVRALRLNTLSKLSYEDSQSFEKLIKVTFPGVEITDTIPEKLHQALLQSYQAQGLTVNENQMRKCIELYEQLKQRMGVVIVGLPGTGKTTVRNLLKHALNKIGGNVSQHIICPKAMSRIDLLGYIDTDTRQWNDGVISSTALTVSNQPSDVWSWVVCDGDVDPEWIESLNSVLDDNRLLTLPSGWRIQFGDNVNFIFETHNLSYASPATITRMGIILLSEEECCFKEAIQTWVSTNGISDEWKAIMTPLLQKNMGKALQWATNNSNKFIIPCHTMSMVQQILSFLNLTEVNTKGIEEPIASALARGLSCIVTSEVVDPLIEQVSEWTGVSSHVLLWKNSSLMDMGWDAPTKSDSFLMSERIKAMLDLTQSWLDSFQHFIVLGPPASGKSLVIEHLLKEVRDYTVIDLQCTPVFNEQHIIRALKQNSAVTLGGSKSGGRVVLVIRSLQRASSDKWNSSLVQSFLLQLVQHGGFWERTEGSSLRWVSLRSFLLVITATTGEGSFKLCPRLTNCLKLASLIEPDEKELFQICSLHLDNSLQSLLKTNNEKQKIEELSSAMFSLYRESSETFTSEMHYKWTPRDLTSWCKNLGKYKINNFESIIHVIYEEAVCIFRDRLITEDERKIFDTLSLKLLGRSSTLEHYFMPIITQKGIFVELIDRDNWSQLINKIINQCNAEMDNGSSSAFGDSSAECCIELMRLCTCAGRAMGGGAVMAGSGGVGRRAAVTITANMLGAKIINIATPQQFHLQIKNILSWCGEGITTFVVIEEGAGESGEVLGRLEGLLAGGLPLEPAEIDAMIAQVKTPTAEPRSVASFVQNIRKYLGIILLLDVKNDNLTNLLESNRLLYERCHFIWLDKWSEPTLREMPYLIAKRMMSRNSETEMNLSTIPIDNIFKIHSSITKDELTAPYRYASLLRTYFYIYQDRKLSLEEKRVRLQAGVSALTEAQAEVARLKADAAEQRTALAEKQTKANQALNQIGSTMQSATTHKEEMQILKRNMEIENAKLQERKKEIEAELSEVEPVILEARAAVGDIRPESLSEVRSLRAPPEPVRDVLEAVLRLMDIADTSWHSMKQFLSRRGIKEDIRNFDASNISKESLAAVEKLVSARTSSFSEKNARRASLACAPLAAWVLANVKYAHVLHKISPLESEQRTLTKNLSDAEVQVQNLSTGLNTVDERVATLKEQLNTFTKEATEIEIKLSSAQATITKAEQLVSKLSDEFRRWQTNLKELITECDEISTRALLAAGFITYLANEKEDMRNSIMENWCQLIGSSVNTFSLKDFLTTHDDQVRWTSDGLPSDSTALHNAIIIDEVLKESNCGLVPLIIDPNGGTIKWLLSLLSNTPKDFIPQFSNKFNTSLQHAIRFGKVLIIEELTSIDDNWSSLLRGQVPANLMGMNSVNPSFRLVLYSRDETLASRLQPHHRAMISIVDFTPQLQGLTDQFIYHSVKQEEPELQEKLSQINSEKNSLQIQQTKLQVALLSQLSSGDILHNGPLLQSLEDTQRSSEEIQESLSKAAELGAAVEKRCQQYSGPASRAAKACLAVASLSHKHPLAIISVNSVLPMFLSALANSRKMTQEDYDKQSVSRNVVIGILERILTALHKEHHCSLTLFLLHLIYPEYIPHQEWEILISIPEDQVQNKFESREFPSWISEDRRAFINIIQKNLPELYNRFRLMSKDLWEKFAASGEWESIPSDIGLSPFQKILVVWSIKPDKLHSSIVKATSQILGVNQIFPEGDLLAVVERWGAPDRPILVIGAPGADPIDQISIRANHVVGINQFKQVWISQELDEEGMNHLDSSVQWAKKSGGWLAVLIGAGGWTHSALQNIIIGSQLEANPKCRLWIVTEDPSSVPPLFASLCVNVIMEAPTGIKNNLLRTLSLWAPQGGTAPGPKDAVKTRLEFTLALTHSVIQERCAYIPQGWRANYGFRWGDAEACAAGVRWWGRGGPSGGLCGTLYAGRVTCPRDAQLAQAIIQKNFHETVLGHAWKPLGLDITLPMTTNLQDYLVALTQFPNSDSPAQLGLANNIHSAREQQVGNTVISQLKSYYHGEVSLQYDNKLWKRMLTPILSLWKKLNTGPDSLVKSKVTDIMLKREGNGLVEREWEAAVMIVRTVHTDLSSLRAGPTDNITRELATQLIADKTPETWSLHWEGSPRTASSFLRGLCCRAAVAHQRAKKVTCATLPPLGQLLCPARALHALLWDAATHYSMPPESLTLVTTWGDSEESVTDGKVVLRDLRLEGAVWEGGRLQPCRSNTPPFTSAPPISLQYVPSESAKEQHKKNTVEIPIYTSVDRKDLVFNIGAPLADQFNIHLWLLNSTALIIP